MGRGISGGEIFYDDHDRSTFLEIFSLGLRLTGYRCVGWALMHNHYHLIAKCSEQPLDRLMRTTNSRYARYFNHTYNRKGYVFQDQFKSVISQDQNYLMELLRYVHLNPLRAGICKTMRELDRYPWCGHGVLVGRTAWPALRGLLPMNTASQLMT